jgi:hypothetical protein
MVPWLKSLLMSSEVFKAVQILPRPARPRIFTTTLFQGSITQIRSALLDFNRQVQSNGPAVIFKHFIR